MMRGRNYLSRLTKFRETASPEHDGAARIPDPTSLADLCCSRT